MQKRNKFGRFVKGSTSWNTGITRKEDVRIPQPWLNKKRSEETKKKIRKSKLGKKCPKASETKKRLFKEGKLKPWNKGLKGVIKSWCKGLTKETSEGLRIGAEKRRGRKRPKEIIRKGIETRMKNGSYKRSKECIMKTALSNTGKKRSEKTKKKMRLAQLGKKHTKETIKKLRKLHTNPSKKIRENMSKAQKKYFKEHPEAIERLKKQRAKMVFPIKDTKIEVKIQNFLKQLGIEFLTHQYIKIEHGYQCDILIPCLNLVIECDGDFIHCNPKKYSSNFVRYPNSKSNQPAYVIWERDRLRTSELIEKGFKVLRLWGSEIRKITIDKFKEKLEIMK